MLPPDVMVATRGSVAMGTPLPDPDPEPDADPELEPEPDAELEAPDPVEEAPLPEAVALPAPPARTEVAERVTPLEAAARQ